MVEQEATKMADRTQFLMYARRLHDALKHSIEDGDGRKDKEWLEIERPWFEHYACAMYLSGTLSFLEGKYGSTASSIENL